MMTSTITPQKRLREYPNNFLSINSKNELFCDACKKSIDFKKKSSVVQHLETEIHTSNSKKLKTVPNKNFNTDEIQDNFKNDLIIWLSASNVPFDKLNKKTFTSFLNNYLRPVFKIPSSATLRRSFPNLYKSKIDELKDYFSKSKVSVMCDETTDSKSRYVFQIIFIKLDILKENCPKLVDTIFLDEVNYETVSRSIINTLVQMKIDFSDVLFFVTDNASYMKKAYDTVLKPVIFKSIHITCFAHIIALVGETWRAYLSEIDSVIANLKTIFSKSPHRKKRFLEFQSENNIAKPKNFPDPVITRWNSWFNSLKFVDENFEIIKNFVQLELNIDETLALCRLVVLFQKESLKDEIKLVGSKCDRFQKTIILFEERNLKPTVVYNTISDLYFWFSENIDNLKNSQILEDNFLTGLFTPAQNKLKKYFIDGKQPGMAFFKMIKIFDPNQILNLSNDLYDFDLPKQMYDLLIEEWPIYKNICIQLKPIEDDFCLEKWWISHRSRLPNFFEQARWILRAPCSSADSERAFSKYNLILSDSRQSMSEETIKMHNFFYFNFRQHLFMNEDDEELDGIIPLSD